MLRHVPVSCHIYPEEAPHCVPTTSRHMCSSMPLLWGDFSKDKVGWLSCFTVQVSSVLRTLSLRAEDCFVPSTTALHTHVPTIMCPVLPPDMAQPGDKPTSVYQLTSDVEAGIQGFGESNLSREGWQKENKEVVKETKEEQFWKLWRLPRNPVTQNLEGKDLSRHLSAIQTELCWELVVGQGIAQEENSLFSPYKRSSGGWAGQRLCTAGTHRLC